MEFINIKVVKRIKEIGKMIYKMDMEYKNFWINGNIKEILLMDLSKEKVI